jgi:hypothetical protein
LIAIKKGGMCWERKDELCHDGQLFRTIMRSNPSLIILMIGDHSNGHGTRKYKLNCPLRSRHIAFAKKNTPEGRQLLLRSGIGDEFNDEEYLITQLLFEDLTKGNFGKIGMQNDGYASDKIFASIICVPGETIFHRSNIEPICNFLSKSKARLLELDKMQALPNRFRIHVVGPMRLSHQIMPACGSRPSEDENSQ